jgi:beta-xylosidase
LTDLLDVTGGCIFTAVEPKSKERRYFLTFSAVTQTHGRANREAHIASAPSLEGPWSQPILMVRHGGQNSVFEGADGKLFASFSGADPASALRNRTGLVPLEWGWQDMPRKINYNYYTEAGPWDEMDALLPEQTWARDPWLTKEGDYFYYAPSPQEREPFTAGVRMWRSKDLKQWELLPPLYTFAQMKAEPRWPDIKSKADESWNKAQIAWEISLQKLKGTYWITTWMGGVEGKKFIGALLKSTSGKPEGPYEFHADLEMTDIQQVFQDDDGNMWMWSGPGGLHKLKPDLSGVAEPREQRYIVLADATEGANDCGGWITKVGNRWFIALTENAGDYSSKYYWAEKFDGPYHKIGTLAHGGNSNIFDDGKGNWFLIADPCDPAINYGNPFPHDPSFIMPIHFTPAANPPVIRHLHEMPLIGRAVYEP